ncbi:hypothetical protein [Psychroserpens sp. Hel_I_66]|uniref:hypothetical protein n=1 Tax=Psychroserpens sp. Hel_I_66 TaxID=1250004 RepID=UPI0006473C94|nr:hypothetical protein [Psychroserpens sp. Hel_I_66]
METYEVGTNKPIKLKVAIATESIPISYAFLYHSIDDQVPYATIAPFDPTQKTGWKQLDGGNEVQSKIFRVLTFCRFFNPFPNEETFNLAVMQIEDSYVASVNGGEEGAFEMSVKVSAFFENKSCILESELKFT